MATDFERLARKLEPLMPGRVRRWLAVHAVADAELRGLIERQVEVTAHRVLGRVNRSLLLSLPPESVIKGAYHLGTVLYEREKWPAGLQAGELLQGVGIFGRSGGGKTNAVFHLLIQLADRGVPFLLLDWKRTGRHLLPLLGSRVRVYTPGRKLSPFPFDPFVPPPGMEQGAYAGLVADQLAAAYTLGDGAVGLLQQALRACMNTGACTLADLIREVEQASGHARIKGWQASTLRALRSLEFSGALSTAPANQNELIGSLLQRSTIVEVDALPGGAKRFLIPLLCLWVYHARLGLPDRERLRLIIVLEEAHQVLYARSRGQESVMEMLLRQGRELSVGFFVVDQHPHLISSAALGNTYTTICFNLKDPADVAKAAAMTRVESGNGDGGSFGGGGFGGLPVGHAVIKLQDRWRRPFLVRFPKVEFIKGVVTDERLARWMAEHGGGGADPTAAPLAGSGRTTAALAVPGRVRRVPPADRPLSDAELSFIEDVLAHPDDGVKARYRRLRLSGHRGHAIKQRLVREGWLEAAVVPVGLSRKVVLRPTGEAREMLGLSGEPRAGAAQRESIAHEYWKRMFARRLEAAGYAVSIEGARPPPAHGFSDVIGRRGKSSIAVEVETGRSDAVGNVRQGLLAGFTRVVVAVTDRAALPRLEAELARAGLLVPGRVEVVGVVGVWEPWTPSGGDVGAARASGGADEVRE